MKRLGKFFLAGLQGDLRALLGNVHQGAGQPDGLALFIPVNSRAAFKQA